MRQAWKTLWIAVIAAPVAHAQPVWNVDVSGADDALRLYCDAQATAMGNSCTQRDYQPRTVLGDHLSPGFMYGEEVFDWGAGVVAAPVAVGQGTGQTTASTTAVVGTRGVGTPQLVIYFRAITNHSTTQTACPYTAAGHAEVGASLPVQIVGGAAGAAYQVRYQFEYTASAATPYETVWPYWPEDGIICSGGLTMTCPIDPSLPVFSASYTTGYLPERTNGAVAGSGTVLISPGWSAAGVYPERAPMLFANLSAVVDDIITNPGPSTGFDSCSGEFTGRLTLTIDSTVTTGACCRSTDCLVTTPSACAGSFAGSFRGANTACANPANGVSTCCAADINGMGGVSVQDIFDFLAAYFGGRPQGDFNASGATTVQDLFDFLAAYFTGC